MTKKKKTEIPELGGSEQDTPKSVDAYEVDAYTLVIKRMEGARSVVDSLKAKMERWDKMANSRLDLAATDSKGNLQNLDYRSRLCLPVVENAIRSLLAKYVVSLLVRRPFFRLVPIGLMDDDTAKRVEGALIYMFDKMPNFVRNIITFVQEMLVYGTAIGKVYWRKVERKTKKGIVIEYEGAYFEPIHLENFFIDPDATGVDGYWKVHQYWTTKKNLKLKNDAYRKVSKRNLYKNLEDIESSYSISDEGVYTIEANKTARGLDIPVNSISEYDKVQIWEYWSEDNSRIIILANKSIVIYDGENPNDSGMHPFVYAVYEPSKFEFYGRGACEKVRDMHDQFQHINNQINENVTLHNNPGYFAVMGAVTENQILPRPGKVSFVTSSLEEIREKPVIPLSVQVFNLRDEIALKIEQALGSVQMATANAAPVTKEQSATETAIQNRLGNEFHGLNLLMLEIPCLIEVVKRAYMLLQQHAGEEYEFRVSDKEGPGFLHQEDLMDVNFSPRIGVDMMSAEVRVSTMTNMLANLKDIPGLAPELIKILLEESGKLLGVHFSEKAIQMPIPAENPANAISGGPTGVPGALQPEQMNMQTGVNQ